MSKKNFKGGLNSLIEDAGTLDRVRSQVDSYDQNKGTSRKTKTSQIGTIEGETRATFIVQEELLEKIKAIAFWNRKQIKDIVNKAFETYIGSKDPKELKQAISAYINKDPKSV